MKPANKFDAIFSIWIRLRNADENGIVKCITCGKIDHWKNMDCGHYIPRLHQATRWDEMNCQVQCKECNQLHAGQLGEFKEFLIEKYGSDELALLIARSRSPLKLFAWEIEARIYVYNEKVKQLKSQLAEC